MIDRTIEETLLLSGVQIDRHNAVCTGGVEQIENQTGGDGLTTAVLLILARVARKGATTVIDLAEARFKASIMMSCSMITC